MIEPLNHFDKMLENRIRLGIMSVLMVNDYGDFAQLKDSLGLTDGNLASHLKALEKAEYIAMEKRFVGRKPNTRYKATTQGRKAFEQHLQALDQFLKNKP